MRARRFVAGLVFLLLLGAIGGGIFLSRSQWVPPGNVGLIFSATGGLQPTVIKPSRVWVPWMSQLYTYPTMVQSAIYTNDPSQGEVRAADAIQVTTNDNANTPFDVVVWYRVKPEDVITVFNNFRAIPIEEIQAQHIRAAVRQAVNLVGPRYDAFQLMGEKRGEASALVKEELTKIIERKGITIVAAELAGAHPSAEITQRITGRVNSLTDLRIAEIRQEKAKVERDTAVKLAKAKAQAQQLTSSQTMDRSLDLLKLEADLLAIERWNGQLPPVQIKSGQTVIVTPDSLAAIQQRTQRAPRQPQ